MSFELSKRVRIWLGFTLWVGLACTAFALTFGFKGEIANYEYGAAGWPRVLFVGIVIISLAQLFISLHRLKRSPEQTDDKAAGDDAPASIAGLPVRTIAAPVIYVALMPQVGFFVATPFFLASVMLIMGERRYLRIACVTAAIYAVVLLIFVKLLFVPLPIGNWPGFYDFGNWLLVLIR
jgi:hypothetical protein